MANRNVPSWPAFGNDAMRFTDNACGYEIPPCAWRGCREMRSIGPVCMMHAVKIALTVKSMHESITDDIHEEAKEVVDDSPEYVYYLMVGPSTVKIGTTRVLAQRMSQLRTDLQYVVAVEHGGRSLERERHLQFATERIGIREDFILSARLKRHIEELQPKRDEIVQGAIDLRRYEIP